MPRITFVKLSCLVAAACLWGALPSPMVRADEAAAKNALQEKGVRVTSTGLLHDEEADFNKAMSEIAGLKRKLTTALKGLKVAEKHEEACKAEIRRLMQADVGLNAQLANVRNGEAVLNNRLIGALNANSGQVRLLMETQEKLQKQTEEVRKGANAAREAYLGRVLALRPLSEKVTARYEELSRDDKLRSAVNELNAATGKTYALEPSRTFVSNAKRLETIEKSIISEKVPLRRQGNSFYASVVIDGEHSQEMVVDTGASLLTLPHRMAKECGLEVTEADQRITMVIADGSKISGRVKRVDSVRVGQFIVNDIECAILGPEAVEATPLLGMSFLGKFKLQLNADASELSLTRVDAEETAPRAAKKPATRKSDTAPKKGPTGRPPKPGRDNAGVPKS